MTLGVLSDFRATDVVWRDVIDTPSVVVDLNIVEKNLKRGADFAKAAGLAFRPHIKTHKIPALAHAQLALGAEGITAQKISEADIMAATGIDDILISFNIVGDAKLERLADLHAKVRLRTVADAPEIVDGLKRHFVDPARKLGVLVEIDGFMQRCGSVTVEDAIKVVQAIRGSKGLRFDGFMIYPAPGRWHDALDFLKRCDDRCRELDIEVPVLSTGGTPDLNMFSPDEHVTEYRAGSYIYNDRSLVNRGSVQIEDCALSVWTTVVSKPETNRAVIDAGSKVLSSDLFGMEGFGLIKGLPTAQISALSEEHGHLTIDAESQVAIGQRLEVIPNHCCPVSNLTDTVVFVRGQYLVCEQPVAARGTTR